MTIININGNNIGAKNIEGLSSISFYHMNKKVYGAQKKEKPFAVFVSQDIFAEDNIIRWDKLSFDGIKHGGSDIKFYLKTNHMYHWTGPYLNNSNDIGNLTGEKIKIMIIMSGDCETLEIPELDKISLSYFSSSNAVRLFTKTFNLGFSAKNILLTYNAKEDPDSLIRFAVTGFDTIDDREYQYIEPNKVEDLSDLSMFSDKIKIMVEMVGKSTDVVVLNEFSAMFSGDKEKMLAEQG